MSGVYFFYHEGHVEARQMSEMISEFTKKSTILQ